MNSDPFVFWILHASLGLVFVFGLRKDILIHRGIRSGKINAIVLRGEKSRGMFLAAHALIAAVLLHIIDVAETAKGHKIIVTIVDLSMLGYLTFLSRHWQGQIIRISNWWIKTVGPNQ